MRGKSAQVTCNFYGRDLVRVATFVIMDAPYEDVILANECVVARLCAHTFVKDKQCEFITYIVL
jgi:hypothetical protein